MLTGKAEDPLFDLWAALGRALAPFGIAVPPVALKLWREQYERGSGPLRAAERGETGALDEVIRLLRELRGPDVDEAPPSAD